MSTISLKTILEAAIFAAGEPVAVDRLQSLFDHETEKPSKSEIKQTLEELVQEYADRPITLKETASGFNFQVKSEFSPWVGKLWQEKAPRHSRALLETLAIIAYRQPITRAEIEEIRGVSVSTQIVKTLLEQEWIRVVGQKEVPGRPSIYATTPFFLDYFNLKSLLELPSLMELQNLQNEKQEEIAEELRNAALGALSLEAREEKSSEEEILHCVQDDTDCHSEYNEELDDAESCHSERSEESQSC